MSPPTRRSRPTNRAAGSDELAGDVDTSLGQAAFLDGEGRILADVGANLASSGVHTYWRVACDAAILDLAATGHAFTAEHVRERVGVMHGRENALSGAVRAAARRGVIVAVGFAEARRPEAHGRVLRLWRGAT